ncbi:MAG: TetR/AcrR family transcriptional regulator [Myxococcota bacterium]
MGRPVLTEACVAAFRRRACDAAIEIIAEGAQEVSFRQLGAAMGCSHATPYRYFKSKDELFMAVRAECFRRFAVFLEDRLAPIADPIERIHEISRGYADYAFDHTAEFRLMFQLGQPRPEDERSYQAGVDAWSIVQRNVQAAVDAGRLAGDPTDLAHMFWASVHGVVSLELSHRFTVGRDAGDLLRPMVDALCRAHGAMS